MRKRLICITLVIIFLICLCACSTTNSSSTFSIEFIDVGQGDAALVECDGCYMLIDGGPTSDKVYQVLVEREIQHLNILAISHLHEDHIGGLTQALKYAQQIDLTICNCDNSNTEVFKNLNHILANDETSITIPEVGQKYPLGSAEVEVLYSNNTHDNDSLVLLITYGKTRFLFTGDIQEDAQIEVYKKYANADDKEYKIDVIKMPHHGAYTSTLYTFIRTFMPTYAIISVGSGNLYGHPSNKTLDLLNDADCCIYRTDKNGNIIIKSNGSALNITVDK